MPISPEEQADLDAMRAEKLKKIASMYDQMVIIGRMTDGSSALKSAGYSTVENAISEIFRSTQKQIVKLTAEFLRKHPD